MSRTRFQITKKRIFALKLMVFLRMFEINSWCTRGRQAPRLNKQSKADWNSILDCNHFKIWIKKYLSTQLDVMFDLSLYQICAQFFHLTISQCYRSILFIFSLKTFWNRLLLFFLIPTYFRSFSNRLSLWFLIPTNGCSLAPTILPSSLYY